MPASDFDLLIDHGNSRIKWAMAGAQSWSVGEAIDYSGKETDFGPWSELDAPQRIVVSNSAGRAAFAHLENWCQSQWQLKPQLLKAKPAQHGVSNSYPEPETLGSDRWLALIAARQLRKGPLAVIDCGTAVTVDALSGEGAFLGGVISAGPKISAGALIERAAHLDREDMRYSGVFNTDTASAVTAGALIFVVGGIEKVLAEFRPKLGDGFTVFMTGGWAETIAPLMRTEVTVYPDLVLQGIQLVTGKES
ncbi:MAG TPA: hypothetical protein DG761_03980 [Gammaproteobacteria bacterium]|jgi:type III pantothenate kinase|nr:hypothetical protein [Acidiferrobacteraceae bacterium]MDP6398627.1 type III pantothenate kinase [Arenicellales bacterium]MDP6552822.1 type III pantothenate kinase [Arenicellales bacterium]MDP6918924.1 type III pantothenate kinase [Arenicellales bacterium]HCX87161.1 hypothetical protein [Gammaproteobacteria bacterium]|tara:strand:- start:741 stop:1490 length:750 start_codon:yes stop_codon:yes gene_type:complete